VAKNDFPHLDYLGVPVRRGPDGEGVDLVELRDRLEMLELGEAYRAWSASLPLAGVAVDPEAVEMFLTEHVQM